MNKKIKVFSCCILVKGFTQSTICDLQRDCFDTIPNSLYDLLINNDGSTVEEIKSKYDSSDHETIDEYLSYLLEKEYIFLTDKPDLFPPIDTSWDTPSLISNAIIDLDENSSYEIEPIIAQLSELRCQAIEIRMFSSFTLPYIQDILKCTANTTLRSVSLLIRYSNELNINELKSLFNEPVPLTQIIVHNYYSDVARLDEHFPIFSTNELISDESHCGVISSYNFTSNIILYTESKNYNNCLNRKLSVDKTGLIRNCPSLPKSFGDVRNTSLMDVVDNAEFKKIWTITKDQIDVCKDCEYRYVCVDCRAYTKDPSNSFSKPLKCTYDPYTGLYDDVVIT